MWLAASPARSRAGRRRRCGRRCARYSGDAVTWSLRPGPGARRCPRGDAARPPGRARRAQGGRDPTAANRREGRRPRASDGAPTRGPRPDTPGFPSSGTAVPPSGRPSPARQLSRRSWRPPRRPSPRLSPDRPSRLAARRSRWQWPDRRLAHADLVEEGQRPGVALEGDANELAQRGLGLAFDVGGQAELGDRLDVEALVRLQQLDGVEADRRPVVRWPGTAVAQDAAERRDPAESLGRLEDPVAFDAAIDLRALTELVEQVHLVPARDAAGSHLRVEQLVGTTEEQIERLGGVTFLERPIGQLGEIPGGRGRFERVPEAEPGMTDADLGDDVERAAAREDEVELGERLETAAKARGRAADPLGDRLQLAACRGDEGEHTVGLAEVEPRENDGIRRVAARDGHQGDGTTAEAIDPFSPPLRMPDRRRRGMRPPRRRRHAPGALGGLVARTIRLPARGTFRVHSGTE